jgi:hypothetical protein
LWLVKILENIYSKYWLPYCQRSERTHHVIILLWSFALVMHGRSRHCSPYQFVVFCQEVTAWHISSLDASFPHFSIWHQSVALSFGYQGRLCVDCGHPSQITHEKRVDLECETSLVHWEATVVRFLERKKSRIFCRVTCGCSHISICPHAASLQ